MHVKPNGQRAVTSTERGAVARLLARQRTHEVIDSHTGAVIGRYCSLKSAHRVADRMDNNYGAVRYSVRPIAAPVTVTEHCEFSERLAFFNEWYRLTGQFPA